MQDWIFGLLSFGFGISIGFSVGVLYVVRRMYGVKDKLIEFFGRKVKDANINFSDVWSAIKKVVDDIFYEVKK